MAPHTFRDPPPSYAEATGTAYTDQAAARRHSTITQPPSTASDPVYFHSGSAAHVFPPAFCLYAQGPRRFALGESQGAPLYAVTTSSALSPRPDVVLYSDVSDDSAPLAFVDCESFGRSATIMLPAHPGSRFPAAYELLESGWPFTRVMGFCIETLAGPSSSSSSSSSGRRRERFEWRHSSGAEIEALGGRHSGWKLVRATPGSNLTRKHSSSSIVGHSSDGKEVVAVWVGTSLFMSKVLRFRFLGSGADGSLGDRWAIMAVASALAIWSRDRRVRNRGLTASF